VESVLFKAGAIARKGRIEDGTTVTDFDTQERAHKHSIDLTWAHAESKGVTINIVDSPGYRDFLGQVYCAVPVVECAVLVVDADEGVRSNTRKIWEILEANQLPCIIAINRCDRDQARLDDALAQLQEQLSSKCIPMVLPSGAGHSFTSVQMLLGGQGRERAGERRQRNPSRGDRRIERCADGALPRGRGDQ
jgi:elongation factor G